MIRNRTQRLLGRAIVTVALLGALAILLLIYARTGKGGGATSALTASTSGGKGSGGGNGASEGGNGGGGSGGGSEGGSSEGGGEGASSSGGSEGGGEGASGESAGSGGPPLAAGRGGSRSGEASRSGGSGGAKGGRPSGTYTGPVIHVLYGPVQVSVALKNGKLVDVKALQLPTEHPQSLFISEQVAPLLRSEALKAQSAEINIVTGATFTSEGFAQSLAQALSRAHS